MFGKRFRSDRVPRLPLRSCTGAATYIFVSPGLTRCYTVPQYYTVDYNLISRKSHGVSERRCVGITRFCLPTRRKPNGNGVRARCCLLTHALFRNVVADLFFFFFCFDKQIKRIKKREPFKSHS